MNLNFEGNEYLQWMMLQRMARLGMFHDDDNDDNEGAIIREIDDDDEITGFSFSSQSNETSPFEKVQQLTERSSSYLKNGNYEEAYGLVKKQNKLGSEVNFAPVLVKYYVTLMHTDRAEKANEIRNELVSLIKNKMNVSPQDAEKHGDSLLKKKKYFEAILFYHISSELCVSATNPVQALKALQGCSVGTRIAIHGLVDHNQVPKHTINKHVLNDMRKSKERIRRLPIENKKISCLIQSLCLHHLESCEGLVGDIDAQEVSIQEGINLMRKQLGEDAVQSKLLGKFLYDRGNMYLIKRQPNEAVKAFEQAIAAMKKAQDYKSAVEKQEDIKRSEARLKLAQRQL